MHLRHQYLPSIPAMNPAPAKDDGDPRRRLIPVYTLLEDKRVLAMIAATRCASALPLSNT